MRGDEKNTMGTAYFLFAHAYWAVTSFIFFSSTLFRGLNMYIFEERITDNQSKGVLILLMVVSYTVGITSSLKHRRNHWQLALTVTTPYGVYLILEAFPRIPTYLYIASGALLFTICYQLTKLVTTPVQRNRSVSRVLRNRLRRLIRSTRTLIAFFLFVLVMANAFNPIVKTSSVLFSKNDEPQSAVEPIKTISSYKTELANLEEDKWQTLSAQEKADLLQLVADIEANYLGLPDDLQVEIANLELGTTGTYAHSRRLIQVDRAHLINDSAEESVDTVLHEAFHSYQHYLCSILESVDESYRSLLYLSKVQEYHSEFSNYTDGKKDFGKYYRQVCESDARSYAEERYEVYARELGFSLMSE